MPLPLHRTRPAPRRHRPIIPLPSPDIRSAGGELIIAGLTSGVVKLLDDGLHLLETAAFGGAVLVLAVSVPYPRQPHFTINHSEPTTALFPDHNHN